jgi:TP901-1 family phage major tail protein
MATTGKIRSNAIGVWIANTSDTIAGGTYGDVAGEDTVFELVACSTSGTFSGSRELIEATSKDNDGAREILTGGLTWSIQCEGLIEYGLAGTVQGSSDVFDMWDNKTKVRVAWSTGANGDTLYYGDAYVTSYEETAGLNEVASFSATFEGDGLINKKIIDTTNATFNDNND